MLALTFANKADYELIREDDRIDINGLSSFEPGKSLQIVLHHSDGSNDKFEVNHSYNQMQIEWFKAGGALNMLRSKA
jgi:aconitate hydratase